jgi:hypothetical protein
MNQINCKVADFGLSQQVFTKLSEVLLTWQWMAPEVIKSEGSYDERADIFSFGILLWEIATREFPYWEYDFLKDVHVRKLDAEQAEDEKVLEILESNGWVVDKNKLEATRVQFKRHKGIELILDVRSIFLLPPPSLLLLSPSLFPLLPFSFHSPLSSLLPFFSGCSLRGTRGLSSPPSLLLPSFPPLLSPFSFFLLSLLIPSSRVQF